MEVDWRAKKLIPGVPPRVAKRNASVIARESTRSAHKKSHSAARFGLMITVSTIMMFGMMHFDTTRSTTCGSAKPGSWMTLLVRATMAVIMLVFIDM
jgi:hypothetical protein